jgi:hypothetical protein
MLQPAAAQPPAINSSAMPSPAAVVAIAQLQGSRCTAVSDSVIPAAATCSDDSSSSYSKKPLQPTDAAPDEASTAIATPATVVKPAYRVKVASHEWLHRAMSPSDWSYSPPPSCSPRAVGAQLGSTCSSSDTRSTPTSTTAAGAAGTAAISAAGGHKRSIEAFPLSESCGSEYDETDESVRSCDAGSSIAGDCDASVLSVTIPPLFDEDFDCALSSKSTSEHAAVRAATMSESCSPEQSSHSNNCSSSAVDADVAQSCIDSCVDAAETIQQQRQQQQQQTATDEQSHSNSSSISSSDIEKISSTADTQTADIQTASTTATPTAVAATAAAPQTLSPAACSKRRCCTAVSLGLSAAAAAAIGLFMVQSYAPWWLQFGTSSSSSGNSSSWGACDALQQQRSANTIAGADTDQCLRVQLNTGDSSSSSSSSSSSNSNSNDSLNGLLLEIVRSTASSPAAAVRVSRTPTAATATAGASTNDIAQQQQQQHILVDVDRGAMRLWATVPTSHSSADYIKQQFLQLLGLCPGKHKLRMYLLSTDGIVTASSSSSFDLPSAANDTGKSHFRLCFNAFACPCV